MTISSEPVLRARPNKRAGRLQLRGARMLGFLLLLMRNPLTAIGAAIVLVLMLMAMFSPWIATHDPLAQDLANTLQAPSASHWFGTDEFGRDVFSRLVYGSRITLYIVALVSITVGRSGCCWGWSRGITAGWSTPF